MGRKADLQAELDALGIDYKSKDTITVLEAKLAAGKNTGEGLAESPESEARTDQVFATVVGPPSWARNVWQPAFLGHALRFNKDARAQLLIEQAGEPIVFTYMGPSGPVDQPIAEKVAEHPDLEVIA